MVATIKVGKIAAAAGTTVSLESGHVFSAPGLTLQTVSKSTADGQQLITTSQTKADIPDMSITITPKLATSKIFLMYTLHIYVNNHSSTGSWQAALISLTRSIGGGAYSTLQDEPTSMYTVGHTQNTTSAIIYQVQGQSKISGGNVQFNRSSYGPPGKFTAMEIAQ